jgi:type II secretory pathway pseudopilin PulG
MNSQRRGTTLFELILVMVILIIVAAISVPSLGSMYGSYKLQAAVDSVRSAWAEARAHAIDEGRPYRFSVQPDGKAFRVAPDQDEYWTGHGGPSNDAEGPGYVLERSLPSGVRFSLGGEAAPPPADEPDRFDLKEERVQGGNWSTVFVFRPNGTAREDVRIVFRVNGTRPITLNLRGLTGDVSSERGP